MVGSSHVVTDTPLTHPARVSFLVFSRIRDCIISHTYDHRGRISGLVLPKESFAIAAKGGGQRRRMVQGNPSASGVTPLGTVSASAASRVTSNRLKVPDYDTAAALQDSIPGKLVRSLVYQRLGYDSSPRQAASKLPKSVRSGMANPGCPAALHRELRQTCLLPADI